MIYTSFCNNGDKLVANKLITIYTCSHTNKQSQNWENGKSNNSDWLTVTNKVYRNLHKQTGRQSDRQIQNKGPHKQNYYCLYIQTHPHTSTVMHFSQKKIFKIKYSDCHSTCACLARRAQSQRCRFLIRKMEILKKGAAERPHKFTLD